MNIVILGAGEMGSYISSILSKEEHNVILIDKERCILEKLSQEIDVATLIGHAGDWRLLEQLTETSPDFFIAMTGNDEVNVTACLIAKNLGYPKTICRIRHTGYLNRSKLDFGRLFYVDHFIGTEIMSAYDILKVLTTQPQLHTDNFVHGLIQMRSFILPDTWHNDTALQDMEFPKEMIIGLIQRKDRCGKIQSIFPHGADKLYPKDHLTVIGKTTVVSNLHTFFSTPHESLQHVVIIGGSSVAIQLAMLLKKLQVQLKFIEKDDARCKQLAEIFPHDTIIHNNGKDLNVLSSEHIAQTDACIIATKKEEDNILIASLAKEAGCHKVVCLLSSLLLSPTLQKLGISYAASEKVNISNRILSILHAKSILSIASIADDQANVVEIKVSPDSDLIGIPLRDLGSYLPKDLLICVIENKGRIIIGKGDKILSPHDTVIVITAPAHIHELQNLF